MENGWFPLVDASVTQDIRRRAGCVKVSDAVGNCATASSFVDVCFCVGLTHLYWTSLVFQQSAVLPLTSDSLMMHRDILCRVINITVVIIYRIIVRWILNSFPVIICWGVGLKIFHAALTQHHSLLITAFYQLESLAVLEEWHFFMVKISCLVSSCCVELSNRAARIWVFW